jgi:hypothetical protein
MAGPEVQTDQAADSATSCRRVAVSTKQGVGTPFSHHLVTVKRGPAIGGGGEGLGLRDVVEKQCPSKYSPIFCLVDESCPGQASFRGRCAELDGVDGVRPHVGPPGSGSAAHRGVEFGKDRPAQAQCLQAVETDTRLAGQEKLVQLLTHPLGGGASECPGHPGSSPARPGSRAKSRELGHETAQPQGAYRVVTKGALSRGTQPACAQIRTTTRGIEHGARSKVKGDGVDGQVAPL